MAESTRRLLGRPEVVTISVTPTVVAKLLIPWLAELQSALPGVELRTVATEAGATFNQTTLALDAALAGPGLALACRAFVAADLKAGQLVQVSDTIASANTDYFLVRMRSPTPENGSQCGVGVVCESTGAFLKEMISATEPSAVMLI